MYTLLPLTFLHHLSGTLGQALLTLALRFYLPPLQALPNPMCDIYRAALPWVGGAILLGAVGAAGGFALRHFNPHASQQLTGGLIGIGIAMFIIGIVLTPASMTAVLTMFHAQALVMCAAQ